MHRQRLRYIQKCNWHTFVYAPLVVAVVIYLTYRAVLIPSTADRRSPESLQDHCSRPTTMASWAKNFTDIPHGLLKTAQEIDVPERTLALNFEGQSVTINYREVSPVGDAPKVNLFFLHGASFSSQTWYDIGTLQLVAAFGHHAVAIDLPGYGKSQSATIQNRGAFILQLIKELNVLKPVLVCASMSGRYALPAVLKPSEGTCDDHFSGFIPIAPVDTSSFTANDYEQCKVPTMIVYGEKDHGAPVDTLRQMPNSEVFMMRDAGHACYMNDTPEWHRLLYNFLQGLCQ